MAKPKLCKNIKTGAIYWWNENLANDPDIVVLTDKEAEEYLAKTADAKNSDVIQAVHKAVKGK